MQQEIFALQVAALGWVVESRQKSSAINVGVYFMKFTVVPDHTFIWHIHQAGVNYVILVEEINTVAQVRKNNKWGSSLTKLPKSWEKSEEHWTAPRHSRESYLWFICDFNDGKKSRFLPNLSMWESSLSFTSVNSLMAGPEEGI